MSTNGKAPAVKEVEKRLEAAFPGAEIEVGTFRGDDHLEARIVSDAFEDMSLVDQHRMVYAALEGLIGGAVHALSLKTSAPGSTEH